MNKCAWCGRYTDRGVRCDEGIRIGNYRYNIFCSQKCIYEAKAQEDVEEEERERIAAAEAAVAAAKKAEQEEINKIKNADNRANFEKNFKEEKIENLSSEELQKLDEKARSYGYESYSAFEEKKSKIKNILNRYVSFKSSDPVKFGWENDKDKLSKILKQLVSPCSIDRIIAAVGRKSLEDLHFYGLVFSDDALYINSFSNTIFKKRSVISYADIKDIKVIDYMKVKVTTKNGKKIKISVIKTFISDLLYTQDGLDKYFNTIRKPRIDELLYALANIKPQSSKPIQTVANKISLHREALIKIVGYGAAIYFGLRFLGYLFS